MEEGGSATAMDGFFDRMRAQVKDAQKVSQLRELLEFICIDSPRSLLDLIEGQPESLAEIMAELFDMSVSRDSLRAKGFAVKLKETVVGFLRDEAVVPAGPRPAQLAPPEAGGGTQLACCSQPGVGEEGSPLGKRLQLTSKVELAHQITTLPSVLHRIASAIKEEHLLDSKDVLTVIQVKPFVKKAVVWLLWLGICNMGDNSAVLRKAFPFARTN